MKQDVVPAISNMEGELAIQMDGHLIKKPHGHGDVHFCLYRVGFLSIYHFILFSFFFR